ncbi:MAG: flavin reductase [Clostridia bacterium]|nr:flavin reductase [Clostridia bacterium]
MNMTEYSELIKKAAEILPKGAFLTTANKNKTNTMTIGWGTFGFQWGIPTTEVMVRQSRFTKEILDNSMEFTLTFPYEESMKATLGYCGQKSGRDCDKIGDCSISLVPAKEITTPVVSCKGLVIECKVVAKTEMQTELTDSSVFDKWYKNGDLHTIYYGQVLACYELN